MQIFFRRALEAKDSSSFSDEDSQFDFKCLEENKDDEGEVNVDDDDDDSVPFDEDEDKEQDEEQEESDEEYASDYEEVEEEEESLKDADKGVALLQSLFLSDLPDDDDDDESSYGDDDGGSKIVGENKFASALDAFEEFAAESIYTASLLLLGPPEPVMKRQTRATRKLSQKVCVSLPSVGDNSRCDPQQVVLQKTILSS
jgi:hypothetical protein